MTNTKKINQQLLALFAIPFLLLTACEVQPDDSISPNESELLSSQLPNPQDLGDKLVPDFNFKSETGRQIELELRTESEYKELVRRAINAVEASECSNTEIDYWIDSELSDWTSNSFLYADFVDMLNLPTYDALIFENSSDNQKFGKNGEYTQSLTKAFKDLKRFWNIESTNIVLAAMHGDMLLDRDKIIRIYTSAVYNIPQADAEDYADLVQLLLEAFPEYRNGDHPLFTFNAFAQSSFFFPPVGVIPSKIIMGDGILEAYSALGFEDVAPQAILAHEFGHHIQFQLGLFPAVRTPEGTRRTELMADAYSAYYLSHSRGATMQWKRVQKFLEVFFNIGDCGFASNGHHGTPLQRMAAAEWGYEIANSAKKQGKILTSEEFTALFEAKLPEFVAVPLTVQ